MWISDRDRACSVPFLNIVKNRLEAMYIELVILITAFIKTDVKITPTLPLAFLTAMVVS